MKDNSYIYHGGSQGKSGNSANAAGNDVFPYCFGIEGNLPANSFLVPPSNGGGFMTGTGYFTGRAINFLSFDVVVHEFRTNNDMSQFQVALKYVSSVAGPTALTTSAQGTLIARKLFILPDTSNVIWYNEGGSGARLGDVPASSIIYCVVEINTALFLHGATAMARFQQI